MIDIWWMLIVKGKYVSWGHVLLTYIGWIVIGLIIGVTMYFK